jgi:hypothetical protein
MVSHYFMCFLSDGIGRLHDEQTKSLQNSILKWKHSQACIPSSVGIVLVASTWPPSILGSVWQLSEPGRLRGIWRPLRAMSHPMLHSDILCTCLESDCLDRQIRRSGRTS